MEGVVTLLIVLGFFGIVIRYFWKRQTSDGTKNSKLAFSRGSGKMRKALKWVVIVFVGLIILVVIVGDEEQNNNEVPDTSPTASSEPTCDIDFYGVAFDSLPHLSEFELNCEEGRVHFKYRYKFHNPDIQASGYLKNDGIMKIEIYNGSKNPLEPNHPTDEIRFISKSGKEYKSEIETKGTDYPSYINPEEWMDFSVTLPLEQQRIDYVVVKVGLSNQEKLFLKRVP